MKRIFRRARADEEDAVMGTNLNLAKVGGIGPNSDDFNVNTLVFEGGGAKGIAYCGACQVLEEMGILKKCTRFAGTSAGSLTSALLALGFNAKEMTEILSELDYRAVFQQWNTVDTDQEVLRSGSIGHAAVSDYKHLNVEKSNFVSRTARKVWRLTQYAFLSCKLAPKVWHGYGFSYGSNLEKAVGDMIEKKGFPRNLTLKRLYELTGNELCIVTVNVNTMATEYLHPKTAPNTTIVDAIRMSTSFPPFFAPSKHPGILSPKMSYFVDGGILCNYPIHAFDGWYLSMKEEDSLEERVGGISNAALNLSDAERFKVDRSKPYTTLGFKLVSDGENDYGSTFHPLVDTEPLQPSPPTALLVRQLALKNPEANEAELKRQQLQEFLLLVEDVVNEQGGIGKGVALQRLLEISESKLKSTSQLSTECLKKIFSEIDTNSSGRVSIREIVEYLDSERSAFDFSEVVYGNKRKEITSFLSFLSTLLESLQFNVQVLSSNAEDGRRSIVVPTGYLQTLDLTLEPQDKEFLVKCGRKATLERFRASYPKST